MGHSKIRVNHPYTRAELQNLIRNEKDAEALAFQGYVLQMDALSGTYRLVHHSKASVRFTDSPRDRAMAEAELKASVPTIRKRTPQERVDSLAAKITPDGMQGMPGIPEEEVSRLVGETFKLGQPLTAEQVRTAAQYLLDQAEKKHEEKLSKQITRHED